MAQKTKKDIREILISIGYDISKFKQQSSQITSEISKTQKTANTLEKSLKIKYDDATFVRAQKSAQSAVSATQKKVELLKTHLKQIEDAGKTDEVREEYEKLQNMLDIAEYKAEQAKQQLERINNIKLDKIKAEIIKAGDNLEQIGRKFSLFVTTPLIAAGTAAYNFSADTKESIGKAEVVFDEYITKIEELAEVSLKQYGLAKQTIYEWTSLYGDMGTSIGQTKQAAADAATMLSKRLADVISFKNVTADVAQTIGKAIYSGESEPLKNIGVIMNENTLQAYAMANGYNKLYTEMSQLEKLEVRIAYFMQATNNAQGDFERTSKSASNQIKILKESLKELATNFGDVVAPEITSVIEKLNELLEWLSNLDDSTKRNIVEFAAWAAMIGPMTTLIGGLVKVIGSSVTAYGYLIAKRQAHTAATTMDTAATAANTAAKTANTTATAAMTGGLSALLSVVGVVISTIASAAISTSLFGDAVDEAQTELDAFNESCRQQKETLKKATAEAEKEAQSLENLTDRLFSLYNQTDHTTSVQQQMLEIVKILNAGIDDLNLTYDVSTNKLNLNEAAIRKNIAAQKDLVMQNAYTTYAQETANSLAEAEIRVRKILEEYQMTADEIGKIYEEFQTADKKSRDSLDKMTRQDIINNESIAAGIDNAINVFKEKYKDRIDNLDEFKKDYEKYIEYSQKISELQTELDKLLTKTEKTSSFNAAGSSETIKVYDTEAFEKQMQELEWQYKMGLLTTEQYYQSMQKSRDQYLEKNSSAWKSATLEIRSLSQQIQQEQEAAAQKSAQAARDAYNEQKNIASFNHEMSYISTQEYYNRLVNLRDNYLSKNESEWRSATLELKRLQETMQKDAEQSLKNAYDEQIEIVTYYHDIGNYTDQEYYNKLVQLRNKYLKQNTSEWRSADKTIRQLHQQMIDDAKEAAEQAAEEQKTKQSQALSDYKEYVDAQLKLARESANEKIDLINKEIDARKELQEQAKLDKQLAQAEAKLKYEKDETNKKELEKEIARLKSEIEEKTYEKEMQTKKDAIEKAYEDAEKAAQSLVDKYAKIINEKGYSYNPNIENYATSNSATIINNLAGVTAGMVEEIIRKELRAAGVI